MAGRKYDEVVAAIEAGELDPEEAVQELKRFSTSTLKEQAEKVPTLQQEVEALNAKVERYEKAPLRREAFEKAFVDFDSLRPLERQAIENYDGEFEADKVAAFVEANALPTTQVAPPDDGAGAPNAAAVAQAARQAPSGKHISQPQVTPDAAVEWTPEKWIKFVEEHPEEADQILQGKTISGMPA